MKTVTSQDLMKDTIMVMVTVGLLSQKLKLIKKIFPYIIEQLDEKKEINKGNVFTILVFQVNIEDIYDHDF